jgi:Arc/MetJ family transcription regulator
MRTNIDIDDTLMNDALKTTGLNTRINAVELDLKIEVYNYTKNLR